ncbi:serine/threonine protein kinase [Mesobacillus maritimus]|uniref:serine/threonine protein kinase n=1 Tax=Mesobacillus maritimus TaxID=1643336 RepID=UPI00203A48AB|nr:serine/threonine protein kinase [Mesobacillus maritimus]MCM3587337.1 serine/threonine protein kinase [Mesobacillus maritimus]
MEEEWILADKHLSKISITSNPNNEPVTIHGSSERLKCIGIGTDAAVFQSTDIPAYVFKMYADDKKHKVQIERDVYEALGNSPYFSTCFGSKDTYLVLNFEEGITLYDCLLQGIPIPKQVVEDVDHARDYVRQKGLNPRDIHLKNVILQNGRAKIIDVSEYVKPGNDKRWEHLKKGYDHYYHLIKGKPVPLLLIETLRKRYNQRAHSPFSLEEFMRNTYTFLPTFLKKES